MAAGDIARWTGAAADGNWGTAGNWTAESGSPSTPPGDEEIAYFDHRSGTNSNVTAGLDQSARDLYRIIVTEGFSGTIGGAGGGLVISVSEDSTNSEPKVVWGSRTGTLYIGGGSEVIDEIEVIGGGRVVLTGGTVTQTVAEKGTNVTINAGTAAPTVVGKKANITDLGTASGTTLVAIGGRVISKRGWATLTNDGASTKVTDGALAITNLNIYGGGTHTHNSTGTITNANRYNGNLAADERDFTVTNDNYYVGMSQIVQKQGGGKVTVTNALPIGDPTETL